nr:branchpoint-bridging protein-like [Ipomoea batatas]
MENQNPTFLPFFIATWFLLLSTMFVGVKSQEPIQSSTPGLLCISECGTCPAICSPPPAPEVSLKPPPTPEVALKPPPSPSPRPPLPAHSPPPFSFFPPPGAIITPINSPIASSPPSPPLHNYPPSFPYYFLPPLSPPLLSSPPPRPATPPPSPPPPPSNNFNIPASVAPPAGFGQKNFSNPYYYFYVSEAASSKTLCGPIVLAAMLISFHVFSW